MLYFSLFSKTNSFANAGLTERKVMKMMTIELLKVGDKVRHNGGASGMAGDTGVIVDQGKENPRLYKVEWDHAWGTRDHGNGWTAVEALDKVEG